MKRRSIAVAIAVAAALAVLSPRPASGHFSPTAFSKVEATTAGRTIAVVFAFDTTAVLRVLQHDANARVDRTNVGSFGDVFAGYLFPRFTISNGGRPCEHPPALARFDWDPAGDHVVAATEFTCDTPLDRLVVRSVVTRDMPLQHDLVADLRHGRALVRHFFTLTDVEAHIALSSLPQAGADAAGAPADVNPLATLMHFVREGVLHIFTGYDHVAFIVTLVVALTRWRQLALIVTSFTAAHSVTLALATLGLVTLPSRIVEPLIALSVLVVAVDAIARPHAHARTAMAFGFGLVHGLGLSTVLRDLGLGGRELVPALLGFNVGVELGQLAIVAPLFVAVLRLRKREAALARSRAVLCGAVAVASTVWLILRLREALSV